MPVQRFPRELEKIVSKFTSPKTSFRRDTRDNSIIYRLLDNYAGNTGLVRTLNLGDGITVSEVYYKNNLRNGPLRCFLYGILIQEYIFVNT